MRQVTVPVSWLIIGVIAVACLLVIAFVVGQWYAPERLPAMPKGKSFAEIQAEGPKPGLVAHGPAQPSAGGVATERPSAPSGVRPAGPPPGRPSVTTERPSTPAPAAPRLTVAEKHAAPAAVRPGGTEKPVTTETPAPSGPQWRVRIAQLAVSQPDAIDKMRGFLLQKDVETELETSRGFYVLYRRERLTDKKKVDELAARINQQLEAFEKATKIPTSKTAYATQVTKE